MDLKEMRDSFNFIRDEYGVNDVYGVWLFEDGMFLNSQEVYDHRIFGENIYQVVATGEAISIRKNQKGELFLRLKADHWYNPTMRAALAKLGGMRTFVSYFDEDGSFSHEADSREDVNLFLSIVDPLAYAVWKDEVNYVRELD